MAGAYILLLVINWNEYRPRLTPLNILLSLFLLSFAISTFTGVDPYHSFWDNHERMLGLFTIAHYVAYYFVCSSVFKNWADWRLAMRIFLYAGSIAMFIGLLQVFNPGLLLNQNPERIASTLGNPIYVGGYGLFLAFVAFLLFIREKNVWWRASDGILGVLAVLGMFFSGTRGSMLGFAAGLAVAVVGYTIVLRQYPKTRKVLLAIMGVGIITVSIMYYYRSADFVKKIPALGRTLNTSLSDVKASPRWIAWSIAVQSWKEKPVFGWGPNNYFYAFNQHYNPKSLEFGYGETWFDNAHNIIMNTLAVQGSFGILVYLGIFAVGIVVLWKNGYLRQTNPHLVAVGGAFLVAHIVQNITVFENPTSYLYFMFWLSMVNVLSGAKAEQPALAVNKSKEQNQKTAAQGLGGQSKKMEVKFYPDRPIGAGLISITAILVVIALFLFNVQPARANKMTLRTLRQLSTNPALGVTTMREALMFNSPHIDDIRSDIARSASQILNSGYQQIGKERSKEILDLAYDNLMKNLNLHPLDIRTHLTISQLGQLGFIITNDPSYLFNAEKTMEDALRISPRRQQIIYNLAALKMQLNKASEATTMMEQTINDNPKISESYWRLAYIYRSTGQNSKAKEILDRAQSNNIVFYGQEEAIVNDIRKAISSTGTSAHAH